MVNKRYFFILGERSGDLHGANLVRTILQKDPTAECFAWGGDFIEAEGATLLQHYRESGFMGFAEVLGNLGKILGQISQCKKDILRIQPDVLVLIDYAGFNLRMARFAKKQGFRVCYYISPKVWAWNSRRAWGIAKCVDRMFCILPFEVPFYAKYGVNAQYVGNPLLDAIAGFQPDIHFRKKHGIDTRPIVALLPGSRHQEVRSVLPEMLRTATQFLDYQFIIVKVSNLPEHIYMKEKYPPNVLTVTDAAYDVLNIASSAIVTSGTATLETALFRVPQVVVYRTSWVSYQLGKRLINVPYISLVNLIAEEAVVTELIQNDFTATRLVSELGRTFTERENFLKKYTHLAEKVGQPGASQRTAEAIVTYLHS